MTLANSSWRRPHYRLMSLSRRSGKAIRIASGSLSYLRHLASKSLDPGRKWIELSTAPASILTLKKPRRRRARHPRPAGKCRSAKPPHRGINLKFPDFLVCRDNLETCPIS